MWNMKSKLKSKSKIYTIINSPYEGGWGDVYDLRIHVFTYSLIPKHITTFEENKIYALCNCNLCRTSPFLLRKEN